MAASHSPREHERRHRREHREPDLGLAEARVRRCEDPRAVSIEGRIYMTYVAFGGWHSMRIALTSISVPLGSEEAHSIFENVTKLLVE